MKPQDSEVPYQSIFNNALDGLAYCQMISNAQGYPVDFIYIWVNKNFEKVTGLKNVVKKKVTDFISGIDISNPELFEIYGRVSLTGESERFEMHVEALSRWFLVSIFSPKKDFFVAAFQNITDRKQIEKDLEDAKIAAQNVLEDLDVEKRRIAEAKAKDDAILMSIGDGLVVVDREGKIIMLNKAFENLVGWDLKEVVGKSFVEVVPREDETGNLVSFRERMLIMVLSGQSTTTTTTTNWYYVRKDGTRFPVASIITPVIIQGEMVGAVEVFRDITKEKGIDRAKSEFVSLASHQLRTPLVGIQWTIDLFLQKEKLTERGKEYLNDIRSSASRLSALIKLLLNVSRIESGNVDIFPEPLDFVELINECIREHRALCDKGKVSLIFEKHPKTLIASTDKNIFRYIVQNLISNAVEYTLPQGRIEIMLEKKQNTTYLQIRDMGIGIPKNEQEHIFKKFTRASNAVIIKPDGTGLGLYIVRESVNLLGGKIWFESEEGKGSTFYIELPLQAQARKGRKHLVDHPLK